MMKKTPKKEALQQAALRNECCAYLTKVVTGFISLLKGMRVTIGYFFSPKKIVTQQYPENRETLEMMARFRGHVSMPLGDKGKHLCTACGICEKACPNGTISVLTTKDISGRKILGQYIYRFSQCTLCNLCIESCPFSAIEMGRDFEFAVYNREQLTFILNMPQGELK